jgi:hypothetical protein
VQCVVKYIVQLRMPRQGGARRGRCSTACSPTAPSTSSDSREERTPAKHGDRGGAGIVVNASGRKSPAPPKVTGSTVTPAFPPSRACSPFYHGGPEMFPMQDTVDVHGDTKLSTGATTIVGVGAAEAAMKKAAGETAAKDVTAFPQLGPRDEEESDSEASPTFGDYLTIGGGTTGCTAVESFDTQEHGHAGSPAFKDAPPVRQKSGTRACHQGATDRSEDGGAYLLSHRFKPLRGLTHSSTSRDSAKRSSIPRSGSSARRSSSSASWGLANRSSGSVSRSTCKAR